MLHRQRVVAARALHLQHVSMIQLHTTSSRKVHSSCSSTTHRVPSASQPIVFPRRLLRVATSSFSASFASTRRPYATSHHDGDEDVEPVTFDEHVADDIDGDVGKFSSSSTSRVTNDQTGLEDDGASISLDDADSGVVGGSGIVSPAMGSTIPADFSPPPPSGDATTPRVTLRPCDAPPSRYETFSGTKVFEWTTTAKFGRRLIGPMREWADELKYRTGISVQWEPIAPDRVLLREYPHRDDVDVKVYFFGSERAIENAMGLLQEMVQQEPAYVRCALYQRDGAGNVTWLMLRRMNNDSRPPDIPPISLKTPGKWTLLFETRKEAVLRTVYEETGIHIDESALTYTGMRDDGDVEYFWRVPVYYYVAALPVDAQVLGPQTAVNDYFTSWDAKILLQSPDPIDRTWASSADPVTGCAWLSSAKIDELQLPIRGEAYMRSRYLPAPHLVELRKTLALE